MVNNFNNAVDKQEYIFKLLPDFGVFDIAEKWFIDNNFFISETKPNGENIKDLFFYNTTDTDIINFRRFIVKSNGDINNSKNNNSAEIIEYDFKINNDNYKVIIDEQFLSGGFNVSQTGGDYLIGVCF